MLRKICQCKREEIVEEMYSRMSVLCLNNKYCTLGVLFFCQYKMGQFKSTGNIKCGILFFHLGLTY